MAKKPITFSEFSVKTEEQINEISKDLAARYIGKAQVDKKHSQHVASKGMAGKVRNKANKDHLNLHKQNIVNKNKGIKRAAKILTKEDTVDDVSESMVKVPQKFIKFSDKTDGDRPEEPSDGYKTDKYEKWSTAVNNKHTHDFDRFDTRTTEAHGHTHEVKWSYENNERIVKVLFGGEDSHDHKPVPLKKTNESIEESGQELDEAKFKDYDKWEVAAKKNGYIITNRKKDNVYFAWDKKQSNVGTFSDKHGGRLDEALDVSQRMARGRSLKRNKAKLALGRRKASKRLASKDVITKRTRRAVRSDLLKKLTKGVPKSELSPARKAELEKRLKTPAYQKRIDMLSKRKFKDVRKLEMDRKRGTNKKKD